MYLEILLQTVLDNHGNILMDGHIVMQIQDLMDQLLCWVAGNFSGINALDGETDNSSAATPFPISSFTTLAGGSIVASLEPGSFFTIRAAAVTITATDASGNTDTCTFNITVNDTENPTITCPGNINQGTDLGECGAVVTYNVTSTDNCPNESIQQTAGMPSGSQFPVGTTMNTFEVTDAAGNMTTCSFNVTINDTENPTISCPGDLKCK